MSAATYDGAAWRRHVIGMPKADLSPDQKLVHLALETFADYRAGTNAHPGEQVLAEMCNLTTRAVRDALARGRGLGLTERTELANRRRGKSDVSRMLPTETTVRADRPSPGRPTPLLPERPRHFCRNRRSGHPQAPNKHQEGDL